MYFKRKHYDKVVKVIKEPVLLYLSEAWKQASAVGVGRRSRFF